MTIVPSRHIQLCDNCGEKSIGTTAKFCQFCKTADQRKAQKVEQQKIEDARK